MIHSNAIVHPNAKVHKTVKIGPFSVVDEHVTIGAGCTLGPQVHITGHTLIGNENRFHAGCVIGDLPQDVKYQGEQTRLIIGEQNTFREHVTVHRSNCLDEDTVVGSGNMLMANSHVGHNSTIGDRTILANGALVGGHSVVGDGAFLSGNAVVHQFCRVGSLSMMQGCSGVSLDLPPFTIVRGINGMCGLNIVGLKRAGYSNNERLELKKTYRALFMGTDLLKDAVEKARKQFSGSLSQFIINFVANSERGTCSHNKR
ncbi:MAG: acyl-[acyl-carrier-protein]--UDP-N-acetylglucosamine O-acyltransferase [Verrucomicrobiales bacterium]|nr:acyl-[acyl-carrier-protein]--UDP-N-acetylglucosamine O-acyltransferase [Verrucomicrobiales bacterium]